MKNDKKNTLIILIPGFGGSYKEYSKFKKEFGKKILIFSPTWKYNTVTFWIKELKEFIRRNRVTDFVALGFSMGAYIIACSDIKPKATIYASISPLFEQYINTWPKKTRNFLGKRRFDDLGKYIHKPSTTFMIGELEPVFMHNAISRLKTSGDKFIEIKEGDHNILSGRYYDVIKKEIKKYI